MISSPQRNEVSVRLSGYVTELQLLFQKHGVFTGSPADVEAGTRKLSEGGPLAEELSATVRSIVYREHEGVTENDLTELLVAALGGDAPGEGSSRADEARKRISALLGTALRTFSRNAPDAPYQSRLSQKRSREDPKLPRTEPSTFGPASDLADASTQVVSEPPAAVSNTSSDKPGDSRLQQVIGQPSLEDSNMANNQDAVAREVARMLAEDQALRGGPPEAHAPADPSIVRPARLVEEVRLAGEPEPLAPAISETYSTPKTPWPVPGSSPAAADLEPVLVTRSVGFARGPLESRIPQPARNFRRDEADNPSTSRSSAPRLDTKQDEGDFPEYRTVSFIRPEHRTLWVVGLCCLLLGLLAGLLARGYHPGPAAPLVNHETGGSPTSQLKPSPYTLRPQTSPSATAAAPALRTPRSGRAVAADLSGDRTIADGATDTGGDAPELPISVEGRNTAQAPTARYNSTSADALAAELRAASPGSSVEPGTVSPVRPVAGVSSSSAGSVFLSAGGTMASNLVAAPAPVYPSEASAAGVQGRVVVQALVGRDGHVLDAHVTSGDRLLREAALEAVTRWRYRPFLADGRPAEVETVAILDFKLSQ